jgi:hypothetical protein
MRRTLAAVMLAALATMLVAAGCGGDDDGDGEALSKEEFIAQGDENCAEADQELEAAERETFGGLEQGQQPDPEQIEQFATEELVPNIQGQVDHLRELNPPEADEERIDEILDTAQEGLDEIEDDPSALQAGSPTGLDEAGQQLQEYGFEECGG